MKVIGKLIFLVLVSTMAIGVELVTARATSSDHVVYTYRCPRCSLQQQYGRPGAYDCPKDGAHMMYFGQSQ